MLSIEEVLGIYPTTDIEQAIGTIIAMTSSMKPVGSMLSQTKKFYKERKKVLKQNICLRGFHEELKK